MRTELKDFLPLPTRPQQSHKGTFGKILNIAGSKRYSGAAVLSSLSALKTGAGYVTLACPENIITSVASYTPDITFLPLKTDNEKENIKIISEVINNYNVVSLGCGLTRDESVRKLITELLKILKIPTVIDADGLNIIADSDAKHFNFPSVITPHPKELSRLLRIETEEIQKDREKYCIFAAKEYNTICVLKGHNTVVSDGKDVYINESGNSSLAKAGSGDILTGIISGFAAQGCTLFKSAVLGVYLHGICGEAAGEELTEYSVLASDLLNYIPFGIKKSFKNIF